MLMLTLAALLAAGGAAAAAQEIKIGYVDLQRALNEWEAGKAAKERFKMQVDKLQGDLKKQKERWTA